MECPRPLQWIAHSASVLSILQKSIGLYYKAGRPLRCHVSPEDSGVCVSAVGGISDQACKWGSGNECSPLLPCDDDMDDGSDDMRLRCERMSRRPTCLGLSSINIHIEV